MKRIGMGTLVALLVLGLVSALGVTSSSAAPAQDGLQCVVPPDSDYPPTGGNVGLEPLVLTSGHFNPGQTAGNSVVIDGASTGVYCGQGFSTPFFLPNATANSAGRLNYSNFAVPADFQLNAMHHIDIYKLRVKVGNFDFCVDKKGDIAPTSVCKTALANKDGKLPRTGVDQLMVLLRAALVALGVGGGALYLRRRRLASRPA